MLVDACETRWSGDNGFARKLREVFELIHLNYLAIAVAAIAVFLFAA